MGCVGRKGTLFISIFSIMWACIFCMCTADTKDVGCPIYENFTICKQPADLLTIDDLYNNAAAKFIQTQKGLLLLRVYVTVSF